MAKTSREFLMLAQEFDEAKHPLAGAFCSEKLDGVRAVWIPQTLGMLVKEIPFANLQKDVMNNGSRHASGLWSRYGNPIWAPDEWIAQLPSDLILDGELWAGRNKFQETMSTIRKKFGQMDEWHNITYMVFDSPPIKALFTPGKIHNNQWKHFVFPETPEWMLNSVIEQSIDNQHFEYMYFKLKKLLTENGNLTLHEQHRLSFHDVEARRQLDERVDLVTKLGGEGCMVRQPHSRWEPHRSRHLVKVKPHNDSEAKVIGWETGKGRLVGMLGSLTVEWVNPFNKTVQFQLSGFTDEERRLVDGRPQFMEALVTFKYRELTDDGLPKEARFFRPKNMGF